MPLRRTFTYRALLFTAVSLFFLLDGTLEQIIIAPLAIAVGCAASLLTIACDKFADYMDKPGNTNSKAIILGVLIAVAVSGLILISIL